MEFTAADRRWMRRALALARRGWGRTAPNPMVGAVVVRDGAIVGEGFHAEFGGPHAEVVALAAAGDRARGATVYVTLEPCAHTGKTAPCADALIAAGVARVVFGADDPNPIAGGGAAALRRAGIVADGGLEAEDARELNAAFHHRFASDRPFITLKLAMSLDGAVADAARTNQRMTGAPALREAHKLRAGHDAVAVGSETILLDDAKLTVRGVRQPRVAPARIVFDRRGRVPASSSVVRTARRIPTIVVTSEPPAPAAAALTEHGVTLVPARSLSEALRALRARDITSVLCEGGAVLAGALLTAGVVDRLVIFQAPVVFGAGALPAFAYAPTHTVPTAPRWRAIAHRELGEDTMTVFAPAR